MQAPAKHPHERDRMEALKSYRIDHTNDPTFDSFTRIVSRLFQTPMAIISIVEGEKQWFKSRFGVDAPETSREVSLCGYTILQDDVFVVEDTLKLAAHQDNPLVTGDPHVRFYAGAPLVGPEGLPLGSLCVLDTKPRTFTSDERELLALLASQVMAQLSLKKLDREIRVRTHAIDQAPVSMFFVDRIEPECPILHANPAFAKMTGYTVEEAKGMSTFDLQGHDTEVAALLEIRDALTNARSSRVTLKGYRKDKTHFWADATMSPVIESDGSCRYYYVVMDDVTQRKQQDALIASQQQNLIESQKMAALGRMAAGIAHEINNPLSIIRGRSEIMLNEALSGRAPSVSKIQEATQNIMRTVDRIVKIVRGLRGISRSSESDPFVPTSIAEMVEDAVEFCRDRCHRKGIDITLPKIPPESRIACRPEQLVQVLLNLVSNAVDQVENTSEAWVRVEFTELPASVEIAVTDSGSGIREEIRSHLFEPFSTTKEVGQGVGLGLFISKNIIEAHNGSLRVDAKSPNTRFVITLPRDPKSLTK